MMFTKPNDTTTFFETKEDLQQEKSVIMELWKKRKAGKTFTLRSEQ